MTRLNTSIFSLTTALLVMGCGPSGSGAAFTTRLASGFNPAHHTVSVLGVYKDGRMALGSWDSLGSYFTEALGSTSCPAGFDQLVSANQDLANAIDAYTRDEGPTGNLLTQIAPSAKGDLILVVTYAGVIPLKRDAPPTPMGPVNNSMGTTRHQRRTAAADPRRFNDRLDISASLFSVQQSRPVAFVSMTYQGESVKDAMTRFGAEVAHAMPGLHCAGWDLTAKIDPAKVRPSSEPAPAP